MSMTGLPSTSDSRYYKLDGRLETGSSLFGKSCDSTRDSIRNRGYVIATAILTVLNVILIVVVAWISSKSADTEGLNVLIKELKDNITNNADEVRRALDGVIESTAGIELHILKSMTLTTQKATLSNRTLPDQSIGWKRSGDWRYKLFEEKSTYSKANDVCKSFGGRLAAKILRDPAAARYIKQRNYGIWRDGTSFWIGYDDRKIEGTWVWADGGQTNENTTVWRKGEPNDKRNGSNCAIIVKNSPLLLMDDVSCSAKYYFICEEYMK